MHPPLPARALVALLALFVAVSLASASASAEPEWPFVRLDVPAERPRGGGVRVAIVDSGIDARHPAFAGRIVESVDCVGSGGSPERCRAGGEDTNGHGTHIAGIVAAQAINGGPEGIAPDAQILAVRSLSNDCDGGGACRALGELGDVVAGVRWGSAHDADLINLSIDAGVGLDWRDGQLADAISDAWRRGAVVVASTGNRSVEIDDEALGDVPLVLVGAVDPTGAPASYSNLPGTARWALMAPGGEAGGCPGEGVESTYPLELTAAGTGCLSGTSMAAAYITGALASLMSSGLDGATALAHLLATARTADGVDAPAADLGAALRTPVTASGDQLARTVTRDRRELATQPPATGPMRALTEIADRWTQAHPLSARGLGVVAMACGLLVLASPPTGRVRPRPFG